MTTDPIAWDVVFYVLAGATVAIGLLLVWTLMESSREPGSSRVHSQTTDPLGEDELPAWASTDGTMRPTGRHEKPPGDS